METPILTLDEAAARLKVTPRWLQRSHCPRIRAGGKVRFDAEVILAWFRSFSDQQAA